MPTTLDDRIVVVDTTKPTPQPAAAPEPDNSPAPTPEELTARHAQIHKTMGWGNPPEDRAPAPVIAPTPAPMPEPAPATPPPAPLAPPAAPAAPVAIQPTMTEGDVDRAATIAAQRVLDSQRPTAPPAAPTVVVPTFELTPEDRKDFEVVQALERLEPEKYTGKSRTFLDYVKGHYAYQADWTTKNDGEEFDPEAKAHRAWYAANNCGVTDEDIEHGKELMMEERVYNRRIKPLEDKQAQEAARARADKATELAMPVVMDNAGRTVVRLVSAINPELAKLVTNAQGGLTLSPEAIASFESADPIAYDELQRILKNADGHGEDLWPMLLALEFTAIPEANRQLNPQQNQLHARIGAHVQAAEEAKMRDPNRNANGKEFLRIAQYQAQAEKAKDQAAMDALDARYYTLTLDDIINHLVNYFSLMAKKNIEKIDSLAKKRYGSTNGGGQPTPVVPNPAPAPAIPPTTLPVARSTNGKPTPPSVNSAGDTVPTPDQRNTGQKSVGELMTERHFSK